MAKLHAFVTSPEAAEVCEEVCTGVVDVGICDVVEFAALIGKVTLQLASYVAGITVFVPVKLLYASRINVSAPG